MRKYKFKQCLVLFSLYSVGLIITCLIPSLMIIERTKTDKYVRFSDLDIYLNVMATNTNYLSGFVIIAFYTLAFILGLNIVFFKITPCFVTRLKSRNEYTKKHVIDVILFALIFSFLLEFINIIYSFCVFGTKLTISRNLVFFSAIDFISEFLFYMRIGILLFLVGVVINKKLAPFITFAIYALEYFGNRFLPILNDIWLPYKDAVIVTDLLSGYAQPTDIIPIIARGVIINGILIAISYRLIKKKDILENEKK